LIVFENLLELLSISYYHMSYGCMKLFLCLHCI